MLIPPGAVAVTNAFRLSGSLGQELFAIAAEINAVTNAFRLSGSLGHTGRYTPEELDALSPMPFG